MESKNPTPQAPRKRPETPSPSERHPGKKPEQADGRFEDLQVREDNNRRNPNPGE